MSNSSEKVNVDTIIFDVDGTLFNGQSLSLPIFKNCLSFWIKRCFVFINIKL